MFEKILQKLKEQRGQNTAVSDRSLTDLAKTLEPLVVSDDMLAKADLSAAIASINGNINHNVAEAVRTTAEKAEKAKADDVAAKKAAEDTKKQNDQPGGDTHPDEPPIWAQSLMDAQKKTAERLDAMHNASTLTSRKEKLKKTLSNLPDYYANPIIKGFDNLTFDEDESFDNYLTELNTNAEDFKQAAKENGLNIQTPRKDNKKEIITGGTPQINSAFKVLDEAKAK